MSTGDSFGPGYALRLSDAERERYGRMADAARVQEGEYWAAAGIVPGARVLDLGCGPGATLVAMAQVVGPAGSVHGVDGDPEAVAAANALIADRGLANATAVLADLAESGAAPGSADVVVLRHVLAHNRPTEQALVDHAASLLRPGGCVYLVDIDAGLRRIRPAGTVFDEMWERYRAFHAGRGNDLLVGLRLVKLIEAAGLEVVLDSAVLIITDLGPGFRPPAWAARGAMLEAGIVSAADVQRWEVALSDLGSAPRPPRAYFPVFVAAGRLASTPHRVGAQSDRAIGRG